MTLNTGDPSYQIDETVVTNLDEKYGSPTQNYQQILRVISAANKFTPREIANFSGHFLATMFDPASPEFRKVKSVLGDIYYFNYTGLLDIENDNISKTDTFRENLENAIQNISRQHQESSELSGPNAENKVE